MGTKPSSRLLFTVSTFSACYAALRQHLPRRVETVSKGCANQFMGAGRNKLSCCSVSKSATVRNRDSFFVRDVRIVWQSGAGKSGALPVFRRARRNPACPGPVFPCTAVPAEGHGGENHERANSIRYSCKYPICHRRRDCRRDSHRTFGDTKFLPDRDVYASTASRSLCGHR